MRLLVRVQANRVKSVANNRSNDTGKIFDRTETHTYTLRPLKDSQKELELTLRESNLADFRQPETEFKIPTCTDSKVPRHAAEFVILNFYVI